MSQLLLASASPRRAEILRALGVHFEVRTAPCKEIHFSGDPVGTVATNAMAKWQAAHLAYPTHVLLAADTVVEFQGHVLGKPHSPEEAMAWLTAYAGQVQTVYTAVALGLPDMDEPSLRIEASRLQFKHYDLATVERYLALVQPFDRAGAYDINCHGELLIKDRIGSYSNVMGLPRGIVHDWLKAYAPQVFSHTHV